MKPIKIQLVLELKPNDLRQRRIFDEWALGELVEDPLLYRKIVLSDEVRFGLNGYVNKQNWSENQPKELEELYYAMHPEKVTA